MSDVYVYYFMRSRETPGRNILSKRRATLDAIKGRGEAVMESQIVVDDSEVDDNGFLIGGVSDDARPLDALWAQIRSLQRRANSRDALTLSEGAAGACKYVLSLESRELRDQILELKKRRSELLLEELEDRRGKLGFLGFPGDPTTQ